jgi:hypothetical protein
MPGQPEEIAGLEWAFRAHEILNGYYGCMSRLERPLSIPTGLAERVDRVRGDQSFEHWVRHQIEAAVLESERMLGLVSARQGDQIRTQDTELEQQRDRARVSGGVMRSR